MEATDVNGILYHREGAEAMEPLEGQKHGKETLLPTATATAYL